MGAYISPWPCSSACPDLLQHVLCLGPLSPLASSPLPRFKTLPSTQNLHLTTSPLSLLPHRKPNITRNRLAQSRRRTTLHRNQPEENRSTFHKIIAYLTPLSPTSRYPPSCSRENSPSSPELPPRTLRQDFVLRQTSVTYRSSRQEQDNPHTYYSIDTAVYVSARQERRHQTLPPLQAASVSYSTESF